MKYDRDETTQLPWSEEKTMFKIAEYSIIAVVAIVAIIALWFVYGQILDGVRWRKFVRTFDDRHQYQHLVDTFLKTKALELIRSNDLIETRTRSETPGIEEWTVSEWESYREECRAHVKEKEARFWKVVAVAEKMKFRTPQTIEDAAARIPGDWPAYDGL
jgi:hypothetical protein